MGKDSKINVPEGLFEHLQHYWMLHLESKNFNRKVGGLECFKYLARKASIKSLPKKYSLWFLIQYTAIPY